MMKKTFLPVILIFILLMTTVVCAEENYGVQEFDTYKIELTPSIIDISPKIQMQTFGEVGESDEILNSKASLPTKYRSPFVSPVKDQGGSGNCWIFSIIGAAEGYMLKHYPIYNDDKSLKTDAYDFSENHMQYMVSNRYNNTQLGHNMTIGSSGHAGKAIPYFLNRRGPADDSDDEFVWPYKSRDYSETANIPLSDYIVTGMAFVKGLEYEDLKDFNSVNKQKMIDIQKKLIFSYGSVACAIHSASEYYAENEKINLYYAPPATKSAVKPINHGVLAVGWDDNYPKENFKRVVNGNEIIPEGDGAFIIKNSWGADACKNGFLYISYYDYYSTYDLSAITNMKPRKNDEVLYSYDDFFPHWYFSVPLITGTGEIVYSYSNYYGNQFERKTENEILTDVSFYAESGFEYYIYLIDEELKKAPSGSYYDMYYENMDKNKVKVYDKFVPQNTGYYTVNVTDTEITSEKFSIMILSNSPQEKAHDLYFERNTDQIIYAKSSSMQSFYYPNLVSWDGFFFDLHLEAQGNFAIKAITRTTDKYSDISFVNFTASDKKEKKNFNKGDTVRIAAVADGVNIENSTLVCGIYNGNKLIKVLDKTIGNKENVFVYEDIPEGFSEFTVRIFALDGYDKITPLGNVISK